jgi:translation initiation factor IF-2
MAKIKVHELAKELNVSPKDLIAQLEKLQIRGKKPQNSLEDDEAARARAALAPVERPQVVVGQEKVMERTIAAEGEAQGEIQAHETVVERRVRANVIRRRVSRVEVAPPPSAPQPIIEEREEQVEATEPAPVETIPEEAAPPSPPEIEEAPPPSPEEPISEPVTLEAEPPKQAPAMAPPPPPEPQKPVAAEPVRPQPQLPVEEPFKGARVLGRIDLRPVTRVEPKPTPMLRPVKVEPPAAAPKEGAATDEAEKAAKAGKKKKRVIKKQDILEFREQEIRSLRAPKKRRAIPGKEQRKTEITVPKASKRVIRISEVISVGELARAIGVKVGEVIKKLMDLGMMATINQMLEADTAAYVAAEFDYQVENVAFNAESALEVRNETEESPEALELRPPVVTIMGHVDHGKTSLLDAIRSANVAAGEAGGITQHIGAYHVQVNGRRVTFLDTPGHEAFTAMRARGAKVTDIVVLVVAADDGVKPQTVEAIHHARAAEVPVIVAVNKMDKPEANLERVKQELSTHGLSPEEWGGSTIFVPVSARTKDGVPNLLEMLQLQAEVLELKANPTKLARGTIVEAKLDRARGPVATVLVQEGTLRVGDPFVCGVFQGRVRAMIDDLGRKIEEAAPSMPVEILGLQGVPQAGDAFVVLTDEAKARQIAEHRQSKQRESELVKTSKVSLEDLYDQIKTGAVKELRVVLKADVHGSAEALAEAMGRLSNDEVKLKVLHGSVGGITESDVLLAAASNAIVIGFNVRPEVKAASLAQKEGVDVRLYSIIYEVMADIRSAMEGLLEPTFKEQVHGHAEVRQTFNIHGVGTIAGCYVSDGKISRSTPVRLLRDQVVVHEGKLSSLKRFKDDVREVASGYECGLALEGFQDIKVRDVVEAYERVPVIRRISPAPREREALQPSAGEK